ncbi:MAG: redox-regulated ATPase YchF [Patescibacteria group bacterium]
MKLSIGIVGLPNVGKSTLFKAITNQEVNIANYPFATIDPNVGVVTVPDERLGKLTAISKSKKTVPAVVEFYDIAGLVKGANQGEGLGNQFLSHIRDTQAVVVVLRVFQDPGIIHVEGAPDPLRDLEIINTELVLKDLDTAEKRLTKLESEAKSGDKGAIKNLEVMKKIRDSLAAGNLALEFRDEEIVCEMQLLTAKKQLYLLNGEEKDVPTALFERIKALGGDYIVLDLKSAHEEAIAPLVRKAYAILDLISFFTTGEDETRAWTIVRGEKAPEAAGAIHSDFEKNFIRAEVVGSEKLLEVAAHSTGSGQAWNQAKQKGLLRIEGKEYVVQDGDVMVIRHG